MNTNLDQVRCLLEQVYGEQSPYEEIKQLIDEYRPKIQERKQSGKYGLSDTADLSERDAVLITYGDQFFEEGKTPLQSLKQFCDDQLKEMVTAVHLLPFFPYSSDEGFSVKDYCAVDPDMGSWQDIDALSEHFRLMFDYVANHMSAQSEWFQGFLNGDPAYEDMFVIAQPSPELAKVTRPRAHPLLTPFSKEGREVNVWTTFSADQVDINYRNPKVAVQMTRILLEYYLRGASMIRLDAILYMWKEIGTNCVHLPQTHALIQMWRSVTEAVFPDAVILAEVSAPHQLNMTYLGNGTNECHMIYQFPLAPLVLYSILKGDTQMLTEWATGLIWPEGATFFNMMACHDGIGMMPVRGILPEEEILWLAEQARTRGGDVSYKANEDGSESPYELNIVYLDAVAPEDGDEEQTTNRFLCAYSAALAMRGVPGLYIQALLGSHNDHEGVAKTGVKRAINRQRFHRETITEAVQHGQRKKIFDGFQAMMNARASSSAFAPYAPMVISNVGNQCFCVLRVSEDKKQVVVALCNMTGQTKQVEVPLTDFNAIGIKIKSRSNWDNLLGVGAAPEEIDGCLTLTMTPYQIRWLRHQN